MVGQLTRRRIDELAEEAGLNGRLRRPAHGLERLGADRVVGRPDGVCVRCLAKMGADLGVEFVPGPRHADLAGGVAGGVVWGSGSSGAMRVIDGEEGGHRELLHASGERLARLLTLLQIRVGGDLLTDADDDEGELAAGLPLLWHRVLNRLPRSQCARCG